MKILCREKCECSNVHCQYRNVILCLHSVHATWGCNVSAVPKYERPFRSVHVTWKCSFKTKTPLLQGTCNVIVQFHNTNAPFTVYMQRESEVSLHERPLFAPDIKRFLMAKIKYYIQSMLKEHKRHLKRTQYISLRFTSRKEGVSYLVCPLMDVQQYRFLIN